MGFAVLTDFSDDFINTEFFPSVMLEEAKTEFMYMSYILDYRGFTILLLFTSDCFLATKINSQYIKYSFSVAGYVYMYVNIITV